MEYESSARPVRRIDQHEEEVLVDERLKLKLAHEPGVCVPC